jgi:hypothetical protein
MKLLKVQQYGKNKVFVEDCPPECCNSDIFAAKYSACTEKVSYC